ncbi:MAG: SOS response-associated peptidase [Rhodobacteraceae bacterium]|jgi:putative SOS response-associated peptidase YedK|nr:SOS response-associated peptidase [Paracoccaceae bacterium]
MCGRFVLTTPSEALAALFEAAPDNDLPVVPDWNVCPTVAVHAVTSEGGVRRLRALRWGFVPTWYKAANDGPLLINARSETIAEKPAFRAAARERRCIVPASGFYEWTRAAGQTPLPWYVSRADGAVMEMAGVWQPWERDGVRLVTVAIVTCAATGPLAAVHDRMPVILTPDTRALWLGEAGHGAARLMVPAPEDALHLYRVGTEVNSNRARGAGLVAALPG